MNTVVNIQSTRPVLELKDIKKSFNLGQSNESEVLHGIDFNLGRGEFCAIVGPSGSGKSTLLNIVGLLDRPSSGSLYILGRETTVLADDALTQLRGFTIGFVFQYHHLISAFSALENVMMPMIAANGFASLEIKHRALDLLESVGLKPWANAQSTRLSGGQQQRVAIARALAMKPALLLADEPTGNLDTQSAQSVFDLLRVISSEQGTSVLFVTHNPALAALCDKTIEVVDGMIR
jgi:lipoprotein-releasing system ATP-binding protein